MGRPCLDRPLLSLRRELFGTGTLVHWGLLCFRWGYVWRRMVMSSSTSRLLIDMFCLRTSMLLR